MIVEPRSNGLHVTCGHCRGAMRAEQGSQLGEFPHSPKAEWMWWRCILNPRHVTRAIPLPVQMARSV